MECLRVQKFYKTYSFTRFTSVLFLLNTKLIAFKYKTCIILIVVYVIYQRKHLYCFRKTGEIKRDKELYQRVVNEWLTLAAS